MNPFSSFNIPGFSFGGDLQKQIVLFLLKKTLGSFVKTEFKIDNLDFQFFQGRASLREIEVNVEAINEKINGQPFILQEGCIKSVSVHIPWTSLMSEPCHIELEGVEVTLSPTLENQFMGNNIASEMFKSTIEASTFQMASQFLNEIEDATLPSSFPDMTIEVVDESKAKSDIENLKKQPDAPYLISGYMEKLLSRLKISLKDIFVSIKPNTDQNESMSNSRVADMMRDILNDLAPNLTQEPLDQDLNSGLTVDQLNIHISKIECFDDASNVNMSNINLKGREKIYHRKFILHEIQLKLDSISDPIFWGSEGMSHELLVELKIIPHPAPPPYQHLNIANSIQARIKSTIKPIVLSISSDQLCSLSQFLKYILPEKQISSQDSSMYSPPSHSSYMKQQPVYSPTDYPDSFLSTDPKMEVNFDINFTSVQLYVLYSKFSKEHSCVLSDIQNQSHLGIDLSRINMTGSYTSHMTDSTSNSIYSDIKVKSFKVWEYLASSDYPPLNTEDEIRSWPRDTYLPIIGFDKNLPNSTSFFSLMQHIDESKIELTGLPSYWSRTKQNRPKSKDSDLISNGLYPPWDQQSTKLNEVEHISIQFQSNGKNGSDISINAQPLWLRVDARMVDRLEHLINMVMPKQSGTQTEKDRTKRKQRRTRSYSEQNIIHDLDRQASQPIRSSSTPNIDLRTDFIRILIYTPSGVFDDDDIRNHKAARIHPNLWIMDVKSPVATFPFSNSAPLTLTSSDNLKIKIEYDELDLLLHHIDSGNFHNFMNISPSTENLGSPNLEITINSKAKPTPSYRNYYSNELPIPFPKPFEDFSEDKVKVTELDEGEEVLGFKQSTIETSLFVINCVFPYLKIELNSVQYDTVMSMVTDISSWEPCFLKDSQSTPEFSNSPDPEESIAMESSFYTANDGDELSSIFSSKPPRILNVNFETQEPTLLPSMLSLVVYMPHIDIALTFDDQSKLSASRRYTLTFQECHFFSVTKFQGKTQSFCFIDSDDLYLFDDSDEEYHRCIISPTIPAHKKPCLSLTFYSKIIPPIMNRKTASLSLTVNGIDIRATLEDEQVINDLASFANQESKISSSRSTQLTLRMNTSLLDISLRYRPINSDTELLFLIQDCALNTHISPNAPSIWVKVWFQSTQILLRNRQTEDRSDHFPSRSTYIPFYNANIPLTASPSSLNDNNSKGFEGNIIGYWTSVGFCPILKTDFFKLNVNLTPRQNSLPLIQLDVWGEQLKVGLCSDSLDLLKSFAEHLSNTKNDKNPYDTPVSSPPPPPQEYNETLDESLHYNILESLDQNAFNLNPTESLNNSQTEIQIPNQYSPIMMKDNLEFFESHYEEDENNQINEEGWQHDGFSSSDTSPTGKFSYKEAVEGSVRILDNEPFTTLEEYFSVPDPLMDGNESINLDFIAIRFRIHDLNLTIELFDGNDFPSSLAHGSQNLSTPTSSSHNRSKSSTSSITSSLRPPQPSIQILVTGLKIQFYHFLDKVCNDSMRFVGSVKDLEILDLIPTSTWRKFLTSLKSNYKNAPRDSSSDMFSIEFRGIRPIVEKPPIEYRLRVSILPIRLFIDQDAVIFLLKFFNIELNNQANNATSSPNQFNNFNQLNQPKSSSPALYFQNAEISPLKIKVDYKPKHMDLHQLKEGNLVELVNLFPLEDATMVLDRVKVKGVRGIDKLMNALVSAWLPHITSTQIPGVVSGVAPIRSLVNIGTGVADLILLPFDQYKKDGRIVKGIQHGVSSFARTTTSEAVKLGTKLAMGAQVVLEQADQILNHSSQSTTISSSFEDAKLMGNRNVVSKYAQQPSNMNEGVEFAYKSLKKNWGSAYKTVLAIPVAVQEPSGTQGKMKAVIRAIPIAMIKPMLGATEAVSMTLLGIRNSLDPDNFDKLQDKYKQK